MKKIFFTLVAIATIFSGFSAEAKKPSAKQIEKELISIMDENEVSAMSIALVKGDEII